MAMEMAMAVDHKCGDEGSAECKAAKKKQEEFKTVIEANCKKYRDVCTTHVHMKMWFGKASKCKELEDDTEVCMPKVCHDEAEANAEEITSWKNSHMSSWSAKGGGGSYDCKVTVTC